MIGTQMTFTRGSKLTWPPAVVPSCLTRFARRRLISLVLPIQRLCLKKLLQILVDHTDSKFGFIGDVLRDERGQPYLRTYAFSASAIN